MFFLLPFLAPAVFQGKQGILEKASGPAMPVPEAFFCSAAFPDVLRRFVLLVLPIHPAAPAAPG